MPIDIDTFESTSGDRLHESGPTNAERVMRFLASHPDQAFTQSEICEGTGVKKGSISVVLSRLEDRDLVRHKGNYWALGEDDIASYAGFAESTRTANERFGEEDMDEWLEHAVVDGVDG
ncbi:MarR family protein [Halomicrobium zhouii]|uniref:MarR family protein n=1 Tax=Halomicrobium zhouii TaxID=767519 RepID=A0A1I6L1M6_9EURY|nr:helix-turn-helix domain-containing protein [Halomicrobium zhouii]SFR97346.1 MarR family protein [Halomicrobium zhouii]